MSDKDLVSHIDDVFMLYLNISNIDMKLFVLLYFVYIAQVDIFYPLAGHIHGHSCETALLTVYNDITTTYY